MTIKVGQEAGGLWALPPLRLGVEGSIWSGQCCCCSSASTNLLVEGKMRYTIRLFSPSGLRPLPQPVNNMKNAIVVLVCLNSHVLSTQRSVGTYVIKIERES